MAGKKISELTQTNAIADNDLFIVETNEGTKTVPYSGFKSEGSDVSFNGTGANSIAISNSNLNAKANGTNSIAIGTGAKTNGDSSISIGNGTTNNNQYSVAIGYAAHVNGDSSIAISGIADGLHSTAIGQSSRSSMMSVSLGGMANANNFSVALGCSTKALGDYSVAIGYNAQTSNANSIQLGDASNLSSITAKVSITTTSDERDKTDITEIEDSALAFLNKIKAIRYVFNGRKLYIDDENLSDEEREKLSKYGMCAYDKEAHAQGTKKGSRVRVGVSAQNIQQALIDVFGDSGYANLVNDNLFDYDPDEIPDGVESQLAVNYEGFIPFLIKAVQELDARVKELERK